MAACSPAPAFKPATAVATSSHIALRRQGRWEGDCGKSAGLSVQRSAALLPKCPLSCSTGTAKRDGCASSLTMVSFEGCRADFPRSWKLPRWRLDTHATSAQWRRDPAPSAQGNDCLFSAPCYISKGEACQVVLPPPWRVAVCGTRSTSGWLEERVAGAGSPAATQSLLLPEAPTWSQPMRLFVTLSKPRQVKWF